MTRQYILDSDDINEAGKFWVTTKFGPKSKLISKIVVNAVTKGYGEQEHEEYEVTMIVEEEK